MAVAGRVSHWTPSPGDQPELLDLTVWQLVEEAAARWPDREAVVYSAYDDLGITVRWTFAELRARSREVGRAFVAHGFERGERVGIWATNRPEWLLVQLGAAYAGVVIVPMNPLYRSSEVAYVLGRAGASACFVEPENRQTSLWDILEEAAAELPDLRTRIGFGEAPLSLDEWLSVAGDVSDASLDARASRVRPGDTSQIQFTSGTTGFPKGAELNNAGIVNNSRLFVHRAQLRDGGRHCNPMPFFHCGGCVMATLGMISIGTAHLPTLTFDAARMVDTIDREQATSAGAVPTMLIALEEEVERHGGSMESLEIVVTGGSPVPVEVERSWIKRFGVKFTITYGLTEASPVITQSAPDDPEELQIATCGQPLPHWEVDIVDVLSGERVPIGEQGELRARGSMVMNGYWGDAQATGRAIDEGGWLRSGDLARMDSDGYVSITGRAKEMIIRGGENIYPAEIEDVLRQLPGVLDASVLGVPDERYGEQVACFLRLAEGVSMSHAELRGMLDGRIARYKIPAHLVLLDEFPVTPSGKVQKFKLRERFVASR